VVVVVGGTVVVTGTVVVVAVLAGCRFDIRFATWLAAPLPQDVNTLTATSTTARCLLRRQVV